MILKTEVQKLRLLIVGLSWLTLYGCGEKQRPTGIVSGVVTLKGQPLPSGVIAFRAEDGVGGSGRIQNGEYTVENAPVGPVTITISSAVTVSTKQTQAMMSRRGGAAPPGEQIDMGTAEAQEKIVKVPAKYADTRTSGLTYEVTTGEQKKNFDLD
jgi:hypothetical protein